MTCDNCGEDIEPCHSRCPDCGQFAPQLAASGIGPTIVWGLATLAALYLILALRWIFA